MKTLICKSPGHFEYGEAPVPVLSRDHALVKIRRIGICGTDLHAFEGTQPFFNYPRILGHEIAGEILEIEGSSEFKPGEMVTVIPYLDCGVCIACRNRKPNSCTQMKVLGVHVDGGMSEIIKVPIRSLVHGNGLTADLLALIEPLAIGAHAVERMQINEGEFVLVAGAGPIGLATMEFAKIAGGQVIALDVHAGRLIFCSVTLRMKHVINGTTANITETLREITHGDMPTVVIDATGSLTAIQNGFQYLAHGGRYGLVGLQKGEITFSHPEFHKREATLMSSRNATRQNFEHVMTTIHQRRIDPLKYITHRVSFGQIKDEFAGWLNPANNVIKAMTDFS